jgi:hypothetical protein
VRTGAGYRRLPVHLVIPAAFLFFAISLDAAGKALRSYARTVTTCSFLGLPRNSLAVHGAVSRAVRALSRPSDWDGHPGLPQSAACGSPLHGNARELSLWPWMTGRESAPVPEWTQSRRRSGGSAALPAPASRKGTFITAWRDAPGSLRSGSP